MATTPVAPAPAAAAPVAAPAPPPVSAAPPAPAPTTPAPAAPVTTQPAAGAPPASPSGPQPPAKLNPGEYGNAVDAYQAEVTWKQELEAFREANPGVKIDDESPWVGSQATTDETPAAEAAPADSAAETKPAEAEAKTDDAETGETYSLEDGPAITPQMMNDILKGDEALKAAVEANPAAKSAIMKLAREHAELSQFKGVFPNKDSAEYAKKTAASTTALRMQFQSADTPEAMAGAFDSFMQEFAVMDPATGKQAVDETGAPVYGDDLYMFGEHVVDRYADNTLAEVEARLAANQYTDDAQRERDNDLKLALSIIKDDLHPKDGTKADPDLSHLDENTRKDVQARLDEAKRIEAENAASKQGAGKQSREQIRKEGTAKFYTDAGKRTFDQVDNIIAGLRKAGAVIPDWQLNTPLPGSNISAFKNAVGSEIENFIKADPYEYNRQLQLEMQYLSNPTPENHQSRVKAFDEVLQSRDESGKSLLNRIVTKLVRKYGSDVKGAAEASQGAVAPTASREPAQGAPVTPKPMTGDEAYKMAETQLAKEVKDWHSLGDSERIAQVLGRQRQLLATRR